MMLKIILFLLICFQVTLNADILTYDKVFKNLKGIKEYNNENFEKSEDIFNENSINNPRDGRLHFNKANSKYKTGKLEEAEQEYQMALKDQNFRNRSETYHNLGNVKFQEQDYKEAIKQYRNALIEDPENLDARYNYELTSRFLQQQQQQQQQSQDDQKSDKNEEQQEQQSEQQKEDDNQDQQQQQQKQKQNEEEEQRENEEQQQQQMKLDEKKKEEAEQMLKTLLQKEKEEMKKQKEKLNVDKSKKGKYW
ncbi:MAG: hypothetical protein APR54_07255 [Candidatus Cloacimonas sp. SDB]|nr:MAG: hypothetical protein APR54_07255 [Candidatus Cloacimonas sp. SDB]